MTSILARATQVGIVAAALAFAPTTLAARDGGAFYTVELAQPVAKPTTTVAGGVAWACKDTTCVAGKGRSRPLRMCRELQRAHGTINTFLTQDEALDADKLAQCNR